MPIPTQLLRRRPGGMHLPCWRPGALCAVIAAAAALAGLPGNAGAASRPVVSAWPMARYDAAGTGFNAAEQTLNSVNVTQLKVVATGELHDPYGTGIPVVSGGVAYAESYGIHGPLARLDAFSTSCATTGKPCKLLWTAVVGRYVGGTPTVADGMVLAGGDTRTVVSDPRLFAFPQHCRTDGGVCRPLWHVDLPGDGVGGKGGSLEMPPTVSGKTAYVVAGPAGHAYLFAIPTSCPGPADHACQPLWRGKVDVGESLWPVTVAGGFAYVPDYDGNIYAFHTTCTTANRVCQPAWEGYTGQLGPPSVAVADGLVFADSQDDNVYAFQANGCGFLSCPSLWTGRTHGNVLSPPAVAYGLVVVASDDGHLYAFPESCLGRCAPAWRASYGGTDSEVVNPVIANGVVYAASSNSPVIRAFGVHCASAGNLCQPLWTGAAPSHYIFEGLAVAGGHLYADGGPAAGPARIYVFGPSGAAAPPALYPIGVPRPRQ
jgi:outer membrane protein assembly factor BamB